MKTTKANTHILRLLPIIALALIAAGPAQAATQTWVGNNDGNWNASPNWSPGPLAPSDSLTFGAAGTGGLLLTNNTPAGTSYAGITFNANAGPFTIGGNSITLGGNIVGGNPSIENLNFDIALSATPTISGNASVITLGGVLSGTGYGITRSGNSSSVLTLSGLNTFNGVVTLNNGTLVAPRLANGGSPSSIGQSSSAAGSLLLGNGTTLKYTGGAVSTDRSFTINGTAAGNGATIEASGTGAINWNNTATPAYGTVNQTRTLTLSGSNPGNNTMAALIADNGTGITSLTKANSSPGTWVLAGANTYSGVTTIGNGGIPDNNNIIAQYSTLVATTLANGGSPSSIGQSGNSATNLLINNGAVLKYTGGATTTDRAFTLNCAGSDNMGGSLDASGTGAVQWTSTAPVLYGTTAKTRALTLTGSNTDNNSLAALIGDNGTSATRLYKGGKGKWVLNGPVGNTYSGATTVASGTLVEDFSNLTSGYADLISSRSALTLGGGTLSLLGNASNPSSQIFTNNLTLSAGGVGSGLSIAGASGMTLSLSNTWTRNAGSTLNITLGTGGTLNSTPAVDASMPTPLVKGSGSIAFATVGGANWAKLSGTGTVVGFDPVNDYVVGLPDLGAIITTNYVHTDNATVTTSETVNTLKLDTTTTGQSLAISPSQTLTLAAGGLLFVGANDYSITGGTLAAVSGGGELVVHQYGTGNLTIDSFLGSSTTLTKAGPGTLTLTGTNTYTGATYSGGGGTLVLKNQLALQNSALTLDNSSLVFDSSVAANAFTIGGLSAPYGGPGFDIGLTNSAGAPIALTIGNNNSSGAYYGTLSGPGSLIKVGTGTQNIWGLNTYTGGTVISNGTLQCNLAFNEWFLGGGGPNGTVQVTVYSGGTLGLNRGAINGTLNLNGGTVTLGNGFGGSWAGPVILGAGTTNTLNISGGLTISGVISGGGALTKATSTANVTLTGVNTYTGPTTISAGSLLLSGYGSIVGTPSITLGTGATFDVSPAYTVVALGSGQTLKASATGANAPGKINMASGKGLTLSAGGLAFTAYGGGTNALTLTGAAGSLALNGAPVTVTTTAALAAGNYTLIATNGAGATVSGTSGSLTVNGSGLGSGNSATLVPSSSNLVMTVSTTLPDRLAFTSVPASPYTGLPFSVTVTAQDAGGVARTVTSDTLVTLTVASGGGSLSGTVSGTIPAGSTSVTIATPGYSAADTMTLTATATSGMSLTAITSGSITFLLPPTKLAITSVNGGSSATAGVPFSVVVQAQDATSTPRGVVAKTVVSLTLGTGTGTLNTPLTGTILAGQNSVTISGVIYSQGEIGVVLMATPTSGDTLTAGDSAPFTVVANSAKDILSFTFPTLGAATIAGTNISIAAPANTSVTSLAPTYTVSTFASGLPVSGTALDFSSPQTYVITAQDGSQKAYAVTVNLVSVFAWTNTVSGNWSDAANWTNNFGWVGAPAAAGETNYVLNFNQAGTYTATQDLGDGLQVNQLNVGSPTLTLAGSSLFFTNNDDLLPRINQNSANTLTISNNLALGTNATLGGTGNGQVGLYGSISGDGSLTKTNAGTVTLYGVNTYAGGTTVNAGTLALGVGAYSYLGTGPVMINSGTTLQLNNNGNIGLSLTLNGGTLYDNNGFISTWGGPVVLPANSAVYSQYGGPNISGNVSGPGGLTITARVPENALAFSGTNTYAGPTIIGSGTVTFTQPQALYNDVASSWTPANIIVATNATLVVNVGGPNDFTMGQVGTLLTNLSTVNNNGLKAGASIGFDTANAGATVATYSGTIANSTGTGGGAVGLRKTGAGTLELTGANTYTGTTTVSDGRLLVNGTNSGVGTVTVSSSGTFGGTGTIAGAATYNAGAKAVFTVTPAGTGDSNSTFMTISGVMSFDGTEVHLNLPANLPAGTYTLAASSQTALVINPFLTPVVESGSFAGTVSSAEVTLNATQTKLVLIATGSTTPPPPVLDPSTGFSIASGNATFTFTTVAGNKYRVVYTDNVATPMTAWLPLLTVTPTPDGAGWVIAAGTSLTLTDTVSTAGVPVRFYRIEASAP